MTALTFENTNTGSTKLQYDDTSVNDYVVTLPHKTCTLIDSTDYASADGTIGGTVKARINGTTLYLTTNGANA